MANPFKYIFVDSKISWNIGSSHHSLSFSADGKILGGTTAGTSTSAQDGKVQFWDTDNGATRGSYDRWSWAQFSPTEPDRILVIGGNLGTVLKQEAVNSSVWQALTQEDTAGFQGGCYSRDGTLCTTTYNSSHIFQWDNGFNAKKDLIYNGTRSVSSLIYSPDGFLLTGHNDGQLVLRNLDNKATTIAISPVGTDRVSACAWSADGKWLATGDAAGDTRLWHASSTTNISLAMIIPRVASNSIDTLVFVPDSTALIILGGRHIRVWDIGKRVFLDNRAGLPAIAKNIALDGARNRVALAIDDKICLYDIKRPETQPQGRSRHQPKQKPAGVPLELATMDITDQVAKTKPDPFIGLYFDIYRGAWNLNSPRAFLLPVAIKSLRRGYDARSKPQERKDFEVLFNNCLTTWYDLKNENIVPLLGVSMAFGRFPAMITSWMFNGQLTEYLDSGEDYDQMQLVIGIGSGVAYLHSQNIVHSDIRASNVLVNELGNPCLADPGLLNVLETSPLMAGGWMNTAYRWMAPELMNDPPAKTSFATDVYAFTMTSLEIFTGNEPFAGVGAALIPGRVVQNQRPSRPADIADALWALWNEGWNEDPGKRPDMKSYVSRLREIG